MSQFVRILFPSFLLAGIAVVLFCFAPFSGRDQAAESLLFEARLSAPAQGELRLYYVRDGAASPREFASAVVPAGPQITPRFVIPAGTYRAFRIVPAENSASVAIAGARIADLAGVEVAQLEKERFHAMAGAAGVEILCAPPLSLRSSLAAGAGQSAALLVTLTLVIAAGLWRFAGPLESARVAALAAVSRGVGHARTRPVLTLFVVAVTTVLVSCYPVVFCGQSFVSPNNGGACLYAGYPTLPDAPAGPIENPKFADIGAMLWAHLPYSVVEHRAIFRDHELPLWNRANSCGVPLLGQGQSMIGDPLHWIPLCAGGCPLPKMRRRDNR